MIEAESSMTSREELHKLVDHIPDADVAAARKILRSLVDPVELSLLTAPFDDEPESEEELAAVEKALSDPRSDVPMEDVLREYDL
jgi:hypothetical protein